LVTDPRRALLRAGLAEIATGGHAKEIPAEGDLLKIMKRQTDVAPADSAADKRITAGAPSPIQLAASRDERRGRVAVDGDVTAQLRALRTRTEPATPVEAAAALIELSLHESNGPMEDLSRALGRMARLVEAGGNGPPNREQLSRELAICIESLQFHDRLTQQLTQVRNLLATLAFSDVPTDAAGRPLGGDQHNWQGLLENLRARFTSDSHRILFNLLLPASAGRTSLPALHANEGSVELF
jgi:hypothetical protein